MKLMYVGESFGVDSLTDGKIYEASEEIVGDLKLYRVIDDSGEDYLYSQTNPAPLDMSSPGGKWVRVDSSTLLENELLEKKIAKCPKCDDGLMKPKFPEHKRIYDYECEKCGYKVHFEPAVIVE